jgi:hypothetical protein
MALPPHSGLWLAVAGASLCAGGLARRVGRGRRRAWYREVYLRSPHWRARRAQAIGRAGGRCEHCGARDRLEIHHLTYERLGRERDRDLRALCHRCHRLADRRRRLRLTSVNVLGRPLGWLVGSVVGGLLGGAVRRAAGWMPAPWTPWLLRRKAGRR